MNAAGNPNEAELNGHRGVVTWQQVSVIIAVAVFVLGVVASSMLYIISGINAAQMNAGLAQKSVTVLATSTAGTIADLKSTVSLGFQTIGSQISMLPDERAQLQDLSRRADAHDQILVTMGNAIMALQLSSAKQADQLNSLEAASGIAPPATHK